MPSSNKVVKVSLSDQVCSLLRDKISNGEYAPGSRLPSETELADTFGVSRLTVRMALQKLNAQGLTITRHGDGTFVKEFDLVEYLDEVSDIMLKPEILDCVLEFRQCIEASCMHLAIERASNENLDELESLLKKMKPISIRCDESEKERQRLLDSYLELDFQFHATICKFSGNSLLYMAYMAARAPICAYIRQVVEKHIEHYKNHHPHCKQVSLEKITAERDHEAILKLLRDRDHTGANEIFHGPIDYRHQYAFEK